MRSSALLLLCASLGLGGSGSGRLDISGDTQPWVDVEVQKIAGRLQAGMAEPDAIAELLRLQALEPQANNLPALRDAYLRAAWTRRGSAELRAFARWRIAHVEWRRGRRPKAARWIRTLGFVQNVALIGPFAQAKPGATRVENPIQARLDAGEALDLAARVTGNFPELRWRNLAGVAPLGAFDLGVLVEPASPATVYVRAVIGSNLRQGAVLRLGTSGPTRVFLRGQEVFASRAEHPARFDQLTVPVILAEGRNEVILELEGGPRALELFFRVSEADGDRLPGVRILDPLLPGRTGPLPGGEARRARHARRARRHARRASAPMGSSGASAVNPKRVLAPRPITLRGALEEAGEASPHDVPVKIALALLQQERPVERGVRPAGMEAFERALTDAKAQALAPLEAEIRWRLSELDDDSNRAREHLEVAHALAPQAPRITLALAQRLVDAGRDLEALALLRELVQATPNFLPGQRQLGALEGRLGFASDEEARTEALYQAWPSARLALTGKAQARRSEGKIDEALTLFRVAASLYPGDDRVSASLLSTLLQRGALENALRVLEAQLAFSPGQPRGWVRLGDLLSANARPSAAERAYARAIGLAPTRARSWLHRLRHHLRAGDEVAARASLAKAARFAPQDPSVKALSRLLRTERESFAAAYLVDAPALVDSVRAEAPNTDGFWTLEMQDLVEVHPSGLASRMHQEIHLALDEAGARALQTFSIAYTPQDQDLHIEVARLIRRDGTILEAQESADTSLSEPWYRLYYDKRARQISFPRIEPGDAVELVWRLDDVAETNWMGDYFGDLLSFQSTAPMLHRRYLLRLPAGREIYASKIDLPGVKAEVIEEPSSEGPGRRIYSWEAREIPRIEIEPAMPGWTEVAAFLHVSTYKSWAEVATWWWGLVKGQLQTTPELDALAATLVEGIDAGDLRARVEAVHRYVVRSTRYVGLEFGVHGFKPYRVEQIVRRAFGDCKDKASLIFSLLRSLGIASKLVILRTRDLGVLPPLPASLAAFNHAILYVPKLELWLDGTAEWAGPGELPAADREASVLVIDTEDPARSVFRLLPAARPEDNEVFESLTMNLDARGAATVQGSVVTRGVGAPALRARLQARDERPKRVESSWARRYPGFALETVHFEGLDDLSRPVTQKIVGRIPRFSRRDGDGLAFVWLGEDAGIVDKLAPLTRRAHVLVIGQPGVFRWKNTYHLPPGFKLLAPREPVKIESAFGSFTEVWREGPGELHLQSRLELWQSRVSPEAYPAFRTFLEAIDRVRRAVIRIAPRGGAAKPATKGVDSASATRPRTPAREAEAS